jgi:hypothetical protein
VDDGRFQEDLPPGGDTRAHRFVCAIRAGAQWHDSARPLSRGPGTLPNSPAPHWHTALHASDTVTVCAGVRVPCERCVPRSCNDIRTCPSRSAVSGRVILVRIGGGSRSWPRASWPSLPDCWRGFHPDLRSRLGPCRHVLPIRPDRGRARAHEMLSARIVPRRCKRELRWRRVLVPPHAVPAASKMLPRIGSISGNRGGRVRRHEIDPTVGTSTGCDHNLRTVE